MLHRGVEHGAFVYCNLCRWGVELSTYSFVMQLGQVRSGTKYVFICADEGWNSVHIHLSCNLCCGIFMAYIVHYHSNQASRWSWDGERWYRPCMLHRGVELRAFVCYCRFILACADEGWNTVQYSFVMQLEQWNSVQYSWFSTVP